MSVEKYSEKEIEETVKAFKTYITKVIRHSAIDFARKVKSVKYTEIVYSDLVDDIVSLSLFDEDTFFGSDELVFENEINKKAFIRLTKKERKIILLVANGYSDEEIAKSLGITIHNVHSSKNIARNKFKKYLEGKNE